MGVWCLSVPALANHTVCGEFMPSLIMATPGFEFHKPRSSWKYSWYHGLKITTVWHVVLDVCSECYRWIFAWCDTYMFMNIKVLTICYPLLWNIDFCSCILNLELASHLLDKLEQLDPLRSEDTLRRLMITHTIDSYWIPSQKKTKSKLQVLKIRQNF